jgi:hypothetical protein
VSLTILEDSTFCICDELGDLAHRAGLRHPWNVSSNDERVIVEEATK